MHGNVVDFKIRMLSKITEVKVTYQLEERETVILI